RSSDAPAAADCPPAVSTVGREVPAAILSGSLAEFWPQDLRRLDLYIPANPAPEEATAALTLAAVAARIGSAQPVTGNIRALDLDQPWPAGPGETSARAVVIRKAAETETRVIDSAAPSAMLLVSAPASELSAAVERLIGVAPVAADPGLQREQ